MTSRIKAWVWVVGLVLVLLICRLIFLKVYPQPMNVFSQGSTDQKSSQKRGIRLESDRGIILDRKGKWLSGNRRPYVLIFPQSVAHLKHYRKPFSQLASWTGTTFSQLYPRLSTLARPAFLRTKDGKEIWEVPVQLQSEVLRLNIPGVRLLWFEDRPTTFNQTLLGAPSCMTKQGREKPAGEIGSGLEGAFDSFLRGRYERWLEYTVDVRNRPLNGTSKVIEHRSQGPGYHLWTTLDQDIQKMAEQTLLSLQVEDGAIVVQDIKTGDLLAAASRAPRDRPGNRVVTAVPFGTLSHTVIALAALQENKIQWSTLWNCGSNAGGIGKNEVTFADAYLHECQQPFLDVMHRAGLSPKRLSQYARSLGLGRLVLTYEGSNDSERQQILEEEAGTLSEALPASNFKPWEVYVTPLQATQFITALYHQGKPPTPRLVQWVSDSQGNPVLSIPQRRREGWQLQSKAVQAVKSMMREATIRGKEAPWLAVSLWPLAGKSATVPSDQEARYHQWMIGFSPSESSRYAVTALVRYTQSEQDPRAILLFRSMMNQLATMDVNSPKA